MRIPIYFALLIGLPSFIWKDYLWICSTSKPPRIGLTCVHAGKVYTTDKYSILSGYDEKKNTSPAHSVLVKTYSVQFPTSEKVETWEVELCYWAQPVSSPQVRVRFLAWLIWLFLINCTYSAALYDPRVLIIIKCSKQAVNMFEIYWKNIYLKLK